ncbi:MAG: hypothetical protein WAU00_08055 [Caldilinea sp.]
MALKRRQKWQIDALCETQRLLDVALIDYASRCYEAADFAPKKWQSFWANEAKAIEQIRSNVMHRTQDFIDHASGKHVETLGDADTK